MSLLIRVRKLDSKLCYNVVNKNISYNTTITHELYIFLELMFVLFPISYFYLLCCCTCQGRFINVLLLIYM